MNDLVTQLRMADNPDEYDYSQLIDLLHEAADEIERLTAELSACRELSEIARNHQTRKLQADNDRLTAERDANRDHARLANHNQKLIAESLEAEKAQNERLRAVVKAAKAMRNDYECYSYSETDGRYSVPHHDVTILHNFNEAVNALAAQGE